VVPNRDDEEVAQKDPNSSLDDDGAVLVG